MNEQTIETRKSGRLGRPESAVWGGAFLLGLLWTIAGVLCLGATGLASLAAVFYVGALLGAAGLVGIVFGARGGGAGVVMLVVGVLVFIHPGTGMAGLTLLVIGYFLIEGVFRIVTSIADRYERWGWDFAHGACAVAIAIIAARAWPLSTFWLLGMLLGADLIVRGVAMMAGAITARHAMRALREGHAA